MADVAGASDAFHGDAVMRVRRWIFRMLAVGVSVFLFLQIGVRAQAETLPSLSEKNETDSVTAQTENFLSDFFSILPDAAKQGLKDDTLSTETLKEAVGFRSLVALVGDYFGAAWGAQKGILMQMLGLALLFCAVHLCGGVLGKHAFGKIFMEAAPALFLCRLLVGCVDRVFSALSELSAFASAAAPVYVALFSAGGATASAAAANGGFALFVSVLEGLLGGILSPLLKLLFCLVLLSSVASADIVAQIGARLRAAYLWILSLASVLFTASLAAEGSLASAADGVAYRTVKFAVGNSIPVVGGAVSSVLGSLASSLSLIKSAFGVGSVLALFSLLLPVFIELLLVRFGLSVCVFLGESMGASAPSGVFARFRSIFDLMLAALTIVSVLFLILLALISGGMKLPM